MVCCDSVFLRVWVCVCVGVCICVLVSMSLYIQNCVPVRVGEIACF